MGIAIISGLSVAIPSILTTILSNRKNNSLVIYRVDQLEKKVDKHNNVVERTYKLEERVAILEAKERERK